MKQHTAIRKYFAPLLLVLFTISFIPKAYFHDVFARHTDTVVKCDDHPRTTECVHEKGINCSFTDLVVNTPYVFTAGIFQEENAPVYFEPAASIYQFTLQHYFFGTVSRGPPAIFSANS